MTSGHENHLCGVSLYISHCNAWNTLEHPTLKSLCDPDSYSVVSKTISAQLEVWVTVWYQGRSEASNTPLYQRFHVTGVISPPPRKIYTWLISKCCELSGVLTWWYHKVELPSCSSSHWFPLPDHLDFWFKAARKGSALMVVIQQSTICHRSILWANQYWEGRHWLVMSKCLSTLVNSLG